MRRHISQGLPMHIGYPLMKEDDSRRHKKWCKHLLDDGVTCGFCNIKCFGSSHCENYEEYNEEEKHIETHISSNNKKDDSSIKSSTPNYMNYIIAWSAINDSRAFQEDLMIYQYKDNSNNSVYFILLNYKQYKQIYIKNSINIITKYENKNLYYRIKNKKNIEFKNKNYSFLKMETHKIYVRTK